MAATVVMLIMYYVATKIPHDEYPIEKFKGASKRAANIYLYRMLMNVALILHIIITALDVRSLIVTTAVIGPDQSIQSTVDVNVFMIAFIVTLAMHTYLMYTEVRPSELDE